MAGPAFNEEKFIELVLYIAEKCKADPRFGAVKLNKILYYADVGAYRLYGQSITGATYQHLSEGPAPVELLPIRRRILENSWASLESRPYFQGVQQRLVPHRPPNMSAFTVQEVDLVEQVIDTLWALTARQVSDLSHEEVGWQVTAEEENIPYELAWLSSEPLTQEQNNLGRMVAERHGFKT